MTTSRPSPKRRPPPSTGPFAGLAPWTPQDDAALRAAFAVGGGAAAQQALPARTLEAIYKRVRHLGVSRRAHWTAKQDALIRQLWTGEHSLEEIASRLGRSPAQTYWRAGKIGLPLGCPAGWERLWAASRRTGCSITQLRQILAADGATVRVTISRRESWRSHYRQHIVPIAQVDAAVAAWAEEEPVQVAARRLGINPQKLRRRLRAMGLASPARNHKWRVTEEQVATAAALTLPWRGRGARAAGARRRGTAATSPGGAP